MADLVVRVVAQERERPGGEALAPVPGADRVAELSV